jgi:hypothetical protein
MFNTEKYLKIFFNPHFIEYEVVESMDTEE